MSSKGAYTNIYDDLGTVELHLGISYKLVVRKALTNPYSLIAEKGVTECVSRSSSAEATSSLLRPIPGGLADRPGHVWRGMVPYPRRSRVRASKRTLERSRPQK